MTNRVAFIAGNWKMNLDHQQGIALVQKLAWSLKDAGHDYSTAEVVVFPGFTSLRSIQTLIDADSLAVGLGAQDISAHDSGAFTGEVSGVALKKLDVQYVLIGHSERRMFHNEDDSVVQSKTAAAFRHGITPVICVGETAEELETEGAAANRPSPMPIFTGFVARRFLDKRCRCGHVLAMHPRWSRRRAGGCRISSGLKAASRSPGMLQHP